VRVCSHGFTEAYWDEILDHGQVRQRIDLRVALDLTDGLGARQRIHPVDVHRARSADAFAARAPERERRVDFVLDLDQRVENHRAAAVHVDLVGVDARLLVRVGVEPIDAECLDVLRTHRRRVTLAGLDPGILGKSELGHGVLRGG
jgi:hypothetical protein